VNSVLSVCIDYVTGSLYSYVDVTGKVREFDADWKVAIQYWVLPLLQQTII